MTTLPPGTRLGPYVVGELLGRGGMGVVYKGHDPSLDRVVALKVLPADFLHDATFADRLRREAQLWGRLDHPAIVPVYYSGVEDDHPFLAMKFIGGGPLSALIRQGPIPVDRSVAILKPVASALDYAHDAGIVHRDVKPANVLLVDDGSAYLTDFGIARALAESRGSSTGSGITGTPGYMAPEQARSPRPDPRSDVYSLGCLAYEMLTGRAPFQGETPMDVMLRHILEAPTPPRSWLPALPVAVETAVLKAMAKDPTQRWSRAGLFVQALEEAGAVGGDTVSLSGLAPAEHPTVRSPARLVAVALLSALVGFGSVAFLRYRLLHAPVVHRQPAGLLESLLKETRRAMDDGDYPLALRKADLATRIFPESAEARNQRNWAFSAWETETSLGLWQAPLEAASPSPRATEVDARSERR